MHERRLPSVSISGCRVAAWLTLTVSLTIGLAGCGRGTVPSTPAPATQPGTAQESATPDPVVSIESLLDQAEQDVDEVSD